MLCIVGYNFETLYSVNIVITVVLVCACAASLLYIPVLEDTYRIVPTL